MVNPTPLTFRYADEILAMQFNDSDCILDDRLLAKSQNATVVGPSGVGKTRLIIQMAYGGRAGKDFVGLKMRGVSLKWLFLQVENNNRRLNTDLSHLKAWIGPDAWPEVQKGICLHTLETDRDNFVFLDDASNVKALEEAMKRDAWDMVVWDSLQNFAVGDLNKDEPMFRSLCEMSRITKLGNADRVPLVQHHSLTGRAAAIKVTGRERAGFNKASKAMHAWTRGQINVVPANPENADKLVLACGKCSNGKEFEPFAVDFNQTTHIYERDPNFDVAKWAEDIKRNAIPPKISDDMVADICNGGKTKAEIIQAIKAKVFVARNTVIKAIERAVSNHRVRHDKSADTYHRI